MRSRVINVKSIKKLLIAVMILSSVIVAFYVVTIENEKKQIEKVAAAYFEGFRTENLDLVMSVISRSFSRVQMVNGVGVPFDYELNKEGEERYFKDNNILKLSYKITKIEIRGDKATVENNTSLEGFSLKESRNFGGSRPFTLFLKKENNKWLIISY